MFISFSACEYQLTFEHRQFEQTYLGKADKRIRPFEDITPLNVRKLSFCRFPRSSNGPYRTELFLSWTVSASEN